MKMIGPSTANAPAQPQRMQKALVQMNLQLSIVISDITGVESPRRHQLTRSGAHTSLLAHTSAFA